MEATCYVNALASFPTILPFNTRTSATFVNYSLSSKPQKVLTHYACSKSCLTTHCFTRRDVAGDAIPESAKGPLDNDDNPTFNSSSTINNKSDFLLSETNTEGLVFDLGCRNSWDSKEIGSPVIRRYLSDDEERWCMWYHGRGDQTCDSIGFAISSNGVHWERGSGPARTTEDVGLVMHCSQDWWAFDTENIRPSDILIMSSNRDRASIGVYWLYYTGFNSEEIDMMTKPPIGNPDRGSGSHQIFRSLPGLAMSQDGKHWARIEGEHHSGALIDVGGEGEWDSTFIASPQVVYHCRNDLRMYYHSFDMQAGCFCIGLARSRDGIKWVKLGKIMGGGLPGSFDEGGVMGPQVVSKIGKESGEGYVMVYEGLKADGSRSIGLAESPDGLKDWRRCSEGVVVLGPSAEKDRWDNGGVGSPSVVRMDGGNEWRLYYRGFGKVGRSGIGMAVSDDGLKTFKRWKGFHL
ncbi:hypothetical protein AMTRI_Chr04g253530 [Amborella trichopoda]